MKRRVWLAVPALVALLALGSAYAVHRSTAYVADDSAGWLDSLDPARGEWVSTTGFARDGSTPWRAPIHLSVDGAGLRLDAGCNTMTVAAAVQDHRLRLQRGVETTLVGCPPEIATTEAWLTALLSDRPQVSLEGAGAEQMLALDTDAGWIGFTRR